MECMRVFIEVRWPIAGTLHRCLSQQREVKMTLYEVCAVELLCCVDIILEELPILKIRPCTYLFGDTICIALLDNIQLAVHVTT